MICPKCNSELKTVPAGMSKRTNKPYRAFIACTNKDCRYTQNLDAGDKKEPIRVSTPFFPPYAPQRENYDVTERLTRLEAQFNATFEKVNNNQVKICAKIEELEARLHAIECVKLYKDEEAATKFHKATAPKIPLMENDKQIGEENYGE